MNADAFADRQSGRYVHTLSAILVLVGLLLKINSVNESGRVIPRAAFQERQDFSVFERERLFASRVIRVWKNVAKDTTALFLCDNCAARAENGKRIVALVEMRNVGHSIYAFLRSLEDVVDAIVVLDDHSTDGSRANIF